MIGIDQLYSKLLNGRTISHPTLVLELKQPHFGWTVGGSLERKDESLIPTDTNHNIFTSIVTTTEPNYEQKDDEEILIQTKVSVEKQYALTVQTNN